MGPSQGGSSLGGPELLLEVAELTRGFRDDSDCLSGRTLGGSRSARRAPGRRDGDGLPGRRRRREGVEEEGREMRRERMG